MALEEEATAVGCPRHRPVRTRKIRRRSAQPCPILTPLDLAGLLCLPTPAASSAVGHRVPTPSSCFPVPLQGHLRPPLVTLRSLRIRSTRVFVFFMDSVFFLPGFQSSSLDSLSMVLDSIKTLHIRMWCLDLNTIIGLLRCFPCLENLYIEAVTHGEGITNRWRKKHRDFLSSHDIRLRTITMERYASNHANTSFATFFLLNARVLLSVRIKFFKQKFSRMDTLNSTKRSFRWTKGLLNVLSFYLQQVVIMYLQIFWPWILVLWIRPIHLIVTVENFG